MTKFLIFVVCLTFFMVAAVFLIKKKVMWGYRGILFIVISCSYFTAIFYFARIFLVFP